MAGEAKPQAKPKSGWLNLLADYGPVVIFFAVYRYHLPDADNDPVGQMLAVVKSTGAFMVAAVTALVFSRLKFGHASPMLWLSTALIVGFGGLTILLHDEVWVQRKPTAIYLMFGVVLLLGVWRRQAYLKYLLEAAFEGLSDEGWLKLSRNWGVFFFALAALNEILRYRFNSHTHGLFGMDGFSTWIAAKLWVFMPLSFLFTFTQIPMLMRHGLLQEAEAEVISDPPHE
jgi:intracellular septation protein